jgi:hypothetical protein
MSVNLVSTTDTAEQVQAALGQKQVAEAQVEEAPAPEATPAETLETSEAQDQEEQEEKPEGKEEKEPKEKLSKNVEKKIGKLTKKASEARAEAEYWRKEALKHQTAPAAQSPQAQPLETKVPDGKPVPENFESHAAYEEALVEWKVEQKLSARDQKAKEAEVKTIQQQREETFFKDREEFAKTKDDFEDVMEGIQDIKLSLTVYESVLDAGKQGPELLYALGKEPELLKRICAMPAIQAAREIGKFEAKLSSPSLPVAEAKTTKAPKPIKPVGTNTADVSTKQPWEMSYREYVAWREKHPNG